MYFENLGLTLAGVLELWPWSCWCMDAMQRNTQRQHDAVVQDV
jgi:hypothetical protein